MINTSFTLLSLLPLILVLVLGYLTHRIILSLFVGIILAALIATQLSPLEATYLVGRCLWTNFEFNKFFSSSHFWDTWNLFICIFLLMLGVFVTLLQYSGGAYAYGNFIKRSIHNAKEAETSSLILSTCLFIDDYFSSLTVGSVMYPLTDSQQVPRAKLSFLVDSMAAPLAILCPFSSWVAAILGFLRENGISATPSDSTLIIATPLATYFHILPFIFYSFILIAATWFIVRFRISFGLMHKHEQMTLTSNNPPEELKHNANNTTLLDFFAPVATLLASVIGGMIYSGKWVGFGGSNSLLESLQQSSAAIALFLGGIVALILCISFFIIRNRITISQLPSIFLEGIKLMLPAVIILMLAWSLGDLVRTELRTGEYLANLMLNTVSITTLPAILFFASAFISFTIGSSWGTAAMIFPIAIPLVLSMSQVGPQPTLEQIPILFPVLGAVLSGCVAGDHISPISDTTVMSATSTGTPLIEHVSTQMPYALVVIFATGLAFLLGSFLMPFGFMVYLFVPIIVGIIVTILLLWVLRK